MFSKLRLLPSFTIFKSILWRNNLLSILGYFGYSLLGFGIGGIVFKGFDKKVIVEEFRKFKKVKNNEVLQLNGNRQVNAIGIQELIKDKTELSKLYNRSIRSVELKDKELEDIKQEIEQLMLQNKLDNKPAKAEKESFDTFLSNK